MRRFIWIFCLAALVLAAFPIAPALAEGKFFLYFSEEGDLYIENVSGVYQDVVCAMYRTSSDSVEEGDFYSWYDITPYGSNSAYFEMESAEKRLLMTADQMKQIVKDKECTYLKFGVKARTFPADQSANPLTYLASDASMEWEFYLYFTQEGDLYIENVSGAYQDGVCVIYTTDLDEDPVNGRNHWHNIVPVGDDSPYFTLDAGEIKLLKTAAQAERFVENSGCRYIQFELKAMAFTDYRTMNELTYYPPQR